MRARSIPSAITCALVALGVVACTAPAGGPSNGTYTIAFPSTAAAVATYTVQLFVFDVPKGPDRNDFCNNLIQGRKRQDEQTSIVPSAPVNICELIAGKKPITIPYGEKAVLAVATRKGVDFLSGCVIQTFGDGNSAIDIDLSLVDVSTAVPPTDCTRVSDFCSNPQKCTAQ